MAHEALSRRLFESDMASLTDATARALKLIVNQKEWPVLDVIIDYTPKIRLRFKCDNWDDQPPSIEILNEDGSQWDGRVTGNIFNAGPHRFTKRSFICMPGSREYHAIHIEDAWANYKGHDGMTLVGVLMTLNTHWRKVAK